jgi:hypothetical protein
MGLGILMCPFSGVQGQFGGGRTFKFGIMYVEIWLKIIEESHLTNPKHS